MVINVRLFVFVVVIVQQEKIIFGKHDPLKVRNKTIGESSK